MHQRNKFLAAGLSLLSVVGLFALVQVVAFTITNHNHQATKPCIPYIVWSPFYTSK